MSVKRKRLLSLAIVFTLTILLTGTWWILSDRNEPGEQKVAAGSAPAGMERTDFIGPATPGPIEPVVVDLSTIAPGQFDPNNKYDRWLRGEVDFSKRHRIVSADQIKSLKAASRRMVPSFGVQNAEVAGATEALAPSPGLAGGFDSIDYTGCCGDDGGGNVPPDPELAAGPAHLIAVVNVAFEIYDKSGARLSGPTTFESFMSANSRCTNVFDPNALYDEEADRFILAVATSGGYYCIAVSQFSNPTASWYIYALPTYVGPGPEFFDYPHAGVGRDAIYVGANIFKARSFKEGRIFALEKAKMYSGDPARYVVRGLGSTYDTPQPLNLHGWNQGTWPGSGPHYFFSDKNFNGRTYAIHSWLDPFGTNTFTEEGVVDLNAATDVTAGMPLNVPQLDGGTVDGGDWRPQDFEYRNGFGWTVMAIACNPGGGTVNCVRWAKIDLAAAAVVDAGVYASDGTYRSYADLAANACGDMAVGYTKSSSSMYPAISYTGRLFDDPDGELQPETELKAGEIDYTSFETSAPRRWGDYTGMTIDPNGETFWYLGEYSKDTGTTDGHWGTYIGSFSFASCDGSGAPPANQPPVAVDDSAQVAQGASVDIDVLANDTDAEDDPLTAVMEIGPSHGTLTLNPNGTLSYTHNGGEITSDSFTYKANDGADDSNVATVSITITPVNDAPVADAQSVSTSEDTAVGLTLTGSDPDGDALTFAVVTPPAHGSLSGTAPNLIYTPTAGYSGADSFTYQANDGADDSNVATVSITITPVVGGTDPVVMACAPSSGSTNQKYTVAVTGSNFQDGATVDFGGRIAVQGVTFVDSFRLDVRIKVNKRAALEPREVTVTNPDSTVGSHPTCFTVN